MHSRSFQMLFAFVLAAPAGAGPIYTVVDLGSLGAGSMAVALNDSGLAAGSSLNSKAEQYGVLMSAGTAPTDLWIGQANGINNAGFVAGATYSNGNRQAAVWDQGTVTLLGSLGGAESEALAVNSSGTVVGRADKQNGEGRAFRWTGGTMQDLGTVPGGTWSAAYAVNDAGAAVGTVMTASGAFRAVLWEPEMMMLQLGTLGGNNSYAFGINAGAQIAGHSTTSAGWMHAFLYSDGLMQDLGTLGGGSSYAYGISDSGSVVGYSWLASGPNTHAFLWRDGVMADLNSLIPADAGWELLAAYAVNGSGQIAGAGLFEGEVRAFRLDPSAIPTRHNPEPGTLLLLGGGFIALGLLRRRRFRP